MEIDLPEEDYLYTKSSQIQNAGEGLFTAIDIYKDEVISYFKGEILSREEIAERESKKLDNYFIEMLDGSIMDSKNVHCFAKYANDASQNTTHKNNAKIALDDDDKVCLIAIKKIKANEEIFCAYGARYWKKRIRSL